MIKTFKKYYQFFYFFQNLVTETGFIVEYNICAQILHSFFNYLPQKILPMYLHKFFSISNCRKYFIVSRKVTAVNLSFGLWHLIHMEDTYRNHVNSHEMRTVYKRGVQKVKKNGPHGLCMAPYCMSLNNKSFIFILLDLF